MPTCASSERVSRAMRASQPAHRVALPPAESTPRHRGLEELTRDPGVAADDDAHAAGRRRAPLRAPLGAVLAERGHQLATDAEGELGGERLDVRDAADAVRPEQSAHRVFRVPGFAATFRTPYLDGHGQ